MAELCTAAADKLVGRCTEDLLCITDFDLTLTAGGSAQCHDVVGKSPQAPAALVAGFAPLLDFSCPFPPELQGGGWWEHANSVLVAEGRGIREQLPAMVRGANLSPRPGALAFLQQLADAHVPVLIVSAGYSDIIEEWLTVHRVAPVDPSLRCISANRMVFAANGDVAAVTPTSPITAFSKGRTYARNEAWMSQHVTRRTLLVVGDRLSDLETIEGAPADIECVVRIGICNDDAQSTPPSVERYRAAFDSVIFGDRGSLSPITSLVGTLPAKRGLK